MDTRKPKSELCELRWLIRRDMADVLRIEAASFLWPWSEADFVRCLRQRNVIGMVARIDVWPLNDRVVGFVVYELLPATIKVLNLAVDPDARRHGVGRQIVANLTRKLSARRRSALEAVVCERSVPAQLFLRACGLRAVATLHRHFADREDDAYLFRFALPRPSAVSVDPCGGAK